MVAGDKEVTDEDIDRAMRQMDADGSGEVDFDECVHHGFCIA
jgi:Ca2+-binding EF-hand superfamily protein